MKMNGTLLMTPSFLSAKNDKFTKYIGKVTKTEGKNWEALAEPMKWSSWKRRDRKNLVVKDLVFFLLLDLYFMLNRMQNIQVLMLILVTIEKGNSEKLEKTSRYRDFFLMTKNNSIRTKFST